MVDFFQCPGCDLIQTEYPHWFDDAPWPAIAALDTGSVERNLLCRRVMLAVAYCLGLTSGARCLDFGGGSGLFVRMMRDSGFEFRWYDKFAENVFARGFEGQLDRKFDVITCFEVFEHIPNVKEFIRELLYYRHDFVLVSTVLHEGHQEGWWYYCPEVGGHVSFYSRRTMEWIGEQYGYSVICAPAFSLLVRSGAAFSPSIMQLLSRVLASSRLSGLLSKLRPTYPSLIATDFLTLRERLLIDGTQQNSSGVTGASERVDNAILPLPARDRILLGVVNAAATIINSKFFRTLRRSVRLTWRAARNGLARFSGY